MKKISIHKNGKRQLALVLILFLFGSAISTFSQVRVSEQILESKIQSELIDFRLVRVVENLEHPWSIAWLPDGRMLVTERPGRLHLINGTTVTGLNNLPLIFPREGNQQDAQISGQAGLLDVAVHPDYPDNGWIYFTYSSPGDTDGVDSHTATATALARARLNAEGTDLVDLETLYTAIPRTEPGRHYGSRIVFPGDGTVLFSVGERGLRYPAQDLSDPSGSMIRLMEDGGAPPDNPFIGAAPGNIRPEIYSFGHRNNQGLTLNPVNGEIWTTEHGPRGGDLLFRIEAGHNYGWPHVAFGTEYSTDEHIGIGREAPGVTPPVFIWEYSMAPSGLTFYSGEKFAPWHGNLLAGSLRLQRIDRLVIENGRVTHKEILISEKIGRIRDVRQGPDGFIYIATDEPEGGIYRLEPVE